MENGRKEMCIKRGGRRYQKPALRRRERLAEVTEGGEVTVTGGKPPEKGGCFERARE